MATGTQLEKSAPATPGQPQLTDRLAGLWGLGAGSLGGDAAGAARLGAGGGGCCWRR